MSLKSDLKDMTIMHFTRDEKGISNLRKELQQIIPGMPSFCLFNCGTMRQTLATIDKARTGIGKPGEYRLGRELRNGQNVFKGIQINRYNLM